MVQPDAAPQRTAEWPAEAWLNNDTGKKNQDRLGGDAVTASPTMNWSECADTQDASAPGTTGFVVGYLVEVSTNALYNGLEGTTENGPVSLRVNLKGADTTS